MPMGWTSRKCECEHTRGQTCGDIRTLRAITPEGFNSIEENDWEEIEMAVDSGATETVVGEDVLTSVQTTQGEAAKRGVQYEVASGERLPNLGEKRFVAYGEHGQQRMMKAQVCDVNKPLLSVHKMVSAGNRVVFAKGGSYVEDEDTKERMYLQEHGGMYMLKLWVQRQPFGWQAE